MYNNRLIVEMRYFAVPTTTTTSTTTLFYSIYDSIIFNIINIKEIKD